MKDEELVTVMVPRSRLAEVYALLGSEPPAEPRADADVIEKAVQESSEDTWEFLRLLAASPGEWLSNGEVRKELGLGVHNLAGVLSTLPRRWRRRYGQSSPLPYKVEGTGDLRRYRMEQEVAEIVMQAPKPAPKPRWDRESFEDALADEDHGGGGSAAVEVFHEFIALAEEVSGDIRFGEGATGPAYLEVTDQAGETVNMLSLNTGGDPGVRYIGLRGHPPYDDEDALRDLADGVSNILGKPFPLTEKATNVKLDSLLDPVVRGAFFRFFHDVARRLSGSSA